MKLELKVAQALIDQKKTLSLAESCSAGLLSHRLTNIPGSSAFLQIGIIAYSNEAKTKILKIPVSTLKRYGAVSQDVAVAMAKGVRKIQKSDFGVSITGIAGPTGGSASKPVGLTFIAVATQTEAICLQCQFQGSRLQIKQQATTQALKLLLEFL